MADMFRQYPDENGVSASCNSHDEAEYEHKADDWQSQGSRYNWTPQGYTEDTTQEPITRRTMERVFNRPSAMQFDGDLKPRSERMATKGGE